VKRVTNSIEGIMMVYHRKNTKEVREVIIAALVGAAVLFLFGYFIGL
jgi:hypothetical protein